METEIIHPHPSLDLIVPEWVDQEDHAWIIHQIRQNGSGGWFPYNPYYPHDEDEYNSVYVDSLVDPRYFLKRKKNTDFLSEARRKDQKPTPYTYAQAGILNEFAVAPIVSAALTDTNLQQKVRDLGFDSISFISPVAGFIERNKNGANKFMVYPFVGGLHHRGATRKQMHAIAYAVGQIDWDLKELFESKGITPGDFGLHSFMISPENSEVSKLYLIDIEGFTRKR